MMASCKALKLLVELDIDSVTCPGVWLPNKGEVLVRLWMLDRTSRTTSILPVFPLVYQENFVFEKHLPDLHRKLAGERIRAELQQLRNGRTVPLANFECSLLTLLFPEVDRPGLHCSEEVSLCMQPLFHFPGVLAPKLEITTRTLIEEATRDLPKKSCIKKTLSSRSISGSPRTTRSINQLARQAHSSRTPSPPQTAREARKKPPFVVRHVSDDIFKLPPPLPRQEQRRRECECGNCNDGACGGCHREASDSDDDDVDYMHARSSHVTHCTADKACKDHCERACTVCRLYRAYFGMNYPHHEHKPKCTKFATKDIKSKQSRVRFLVDEAKKPSCHSNCKKLEIQSELSSSDVDCYCQTIKDVDYCRCEAENLPNVCNCGDVASDEKPMFSDDVCKCLSQDIDMCRCKLQSDNRCHCSYQDVDLCACDSTKASSCQCDDERMEVNGDQCRCESSRVMCRCNDAAATKCYCQDETVKCLCDAHSLTGWCRKKKGRAKGSNST